MKIRSGLVSNSSSSSFICDACQGRYEGWDNTYDGDVRYLECQNGHAFCSNCLITDPKCISAAVLSECSVLEDELEPDDSEKVVAGTWTLAEALNYSFFDNDFAIPAEICPICQMRSIPNYLIMKFLLDTVGKTREEIEEEMRNEDQTRVSK